MPWARCPARDHPGRPDLIVTALMVPRLDGTGHIDRSCKDGFQVPIVVMGAMHVLPRQQPVAAFVDKPFDPNHLAVIVTQSLTGHA